MCITVLLYGVFFGHPLYHVHFLFIIGIYEPVIDNDIQEYDFDVDLYGKKPRQSIRKQYVLTTKKTTKAIRTFGRKMTPHEMNVIYNIQGSTIVLARTEDVKFGSKGISRYVNDVLYDIKGSTVLKILIADCIWSIDFIKSRIKK